MVQYGIGEHEGRLRAVRAHYLNLLGAQDRHIAARDLVGFAAGRAHVDSRRARPDGLRLRFRGDECRDEKRPAPTLLNRHFCRTEARRLYSRHPRPDWQGAAGPGRAGDATSITSRREALQTRDALCQPSPTAVSPRCVRNWTTRLSAPKRAHSNTVARMRLKPQSRSVLRSSTSQGRVLTTCESARERSRYGRSIHPLWLEYP